MNAYVMATAVASQLVPVHLDGKPWQHPSNDKEARLYLRERVAKVGDDGKAFRLRDASWRPVGVLVFESYSKKWRYEAMRSARKLGKDEQGALAVIVDKTLKELLD